MQNSPLQMNASDSVINESLPPYGDNASNTEHNQSNSSNQSLHENPFDKPSKISIFQKYYDRIGQVKINYSNQRTEILKSVPSPGRQVISKFPYIEQLKEKITVTIKQLTSIQQKREKLQQAATQLTLKNQTRKKQIQIRQDVNELLVKIKTLLKNERLVSKEGEASFEVQNEIVKNLQQKSKATLENLRPYLEYSRNKLVQSNSLLEATGKQLENEGFLYGKQIEKQTKLIKQKQALKSLHEVQDEIENEVKYGKALDKYSERHEIDLQLKRNKHKQSQ